MHAVLATLVLGLLNGTACASSGQEVHLGSYKMAGQTVQATLPTSVPEVPEGAPHVESIPQRCLKDKLPPERATSAGRGLPRVNSTRWIKIGSQ